MSTPPCLHVFLLFLPKKELFVTSCLLPWSKTSFKTGFSEKKEFSPCGVNSLLRIDPNWGGKQKGRVATQSVFLHISSRLFIVVC